MNHQKFLGLLNLYLDGELDPDTAAALEREIRQNPARRRTYNDYCRIHRATKLVYERFRAAAAEHNDSGRETVQRAVNYTGAGEDAATSGSVVTPLPRRRPFRVARIALYWTAGLGAASAAAIAAVLLSRAPTPGPDTMAAVETHVAEAPVAAAAAPAQITGAAPENRTFTAPFAPEIRIDPYLMSLARAEMDPFALSRESPIAVAPIWDEDHHQLPAPPASATAVRFGTSIPALAPAAQPVIEPAFQRDAAASVFRSRTDAGDVSLEPVGYSLQR